MQAESRPQTPPSVKTTVSSQTSTGKSRYNRKFPSKWLATPSSTGSGSPTSRASPATQFSPESPAIPESSTSGDAKTGRPGDISTSTLSGKSPTFAQTQLFEIMHLDDHPSSPGPTNNEPRDNQQLQWDGVSRSSRSRHQNSIKRSGTEFDSSEYECSTPTPAFRGYAYQTISPPIGGEALHKIPIGVSPSPPIMRLPISTPHAVAPAEPNIQEISGEEEEEEQDAPLSPPVAALQSSSTEPHDTGRRKYGKEFFRQKASTMVAKKRRIT